MEKDASPRMVEKWFDWVPENIVGGFGIYFLVVQLSAVFMEILVSGLDIASIRADIDIGIAHALFNVIGVFFGAVYAAWKVKEDGPRQGLTVAMLIVAMGVLITLMKIVRAEIVGQLVSIDISTLFVWMLMIVAGLTGGNYGERLGQCDQALRDEPATAMVDPAETGHVSTPVTDTDIQAENMTKTGNQND